MKLITYGKDNFVFDSEGNIVDGKKRMEKMFEYFLKHPAFTSNGKSFAKSILHGSDFWKVRILTKFYLPLTDWK